MDKNGTERFWVICFEAFDHEFSEPANIVSKSQVFARSLKLKDHYRFVELDYGYLTLAPKGSRPGDMICVIQGFNVPMVIRKVDNHFILIGTCFVKGMMHGEIVTLLERGQARIERLEIR